jgi:hypothetical protein
LIRHSDFLAISFLPIADFYCRFEYIFNTHLRFTNRDFRVAFRAFRVCAVPVFAFSKPVHVSALATLNSLVAPRISGSGPLWIS